MSYSINEVFALPIKNAIAAHVHQSMSAVRYVPWFVFTAFIKALIFTGVVYLEFEILYRVFEYLSGGDSDFFTPEVMGGSSLILIVALHFITAQNANHPSLTFIDRAASALVPVYLLGIGLLAAVIIYSGGVADVLIPDGAWASDGIDTDSHWLSGLMTSIASPLAAILFSLGIGAMAIINIFVSHKALSGLSEDIQESIGRMTTYRADKRDYLAYLQAENTARQLDDDLNGLVIRDESSLKDEVITDVLLIIDAQLQDKREALNQLVVIKPLKGLPDSGLDPDMLAKAIKPIEAINRDSILKHLK